MKKTNKQQSRGFALLSVLFIIAALTLMMGTMLRMGGQRAYTSKRLINEIKAQAYAEAGIDYAYSILATDFDAKNDPSAFQMDGGETQTAASAAVPDSDGTYSLMMAQLDEEGSDTGISGTKSGYGEGSFAITLTPIDDKYVLVHSVGTCGDATKEAEILVDDENAGSSPFPDYSSMEGFDYSVLSGGTFNFRGCGSATGSKMHSNSAIDVRGDADANLDISSSAEISTGNVTINGSLTAPSLDIHNKATVAGGTTETSVPTVTIPDIDLTPYFNWAQKNGEVYNGFSTSSSYTPAGGVLWVNGDAHISSHAVINGSIIATGNIHVSGAVEINPTTTTFAIASRDGDINNTSSGTLNGLIYAKTGNYSQTSNGALVGQLIVNGNIRKGGSSDVVSYVRSVPTDPAGDTAPTTAWPVISAWQK